MYLITSDYLELSMSLMTILKAADLSALIFAQGRMRANRTGFGKWKAETARAPSFKNSTHGNHVIYFTFMPYKDDLSSASTTRSTQRALLDKLWSG